MVLGKEMNMEDPICEHIMKFLSQISLKTATDRDIRFYLRGVNKTFASKSEEAIGWRLQWLERKGHIQKGRMVNRDQLYYINDPPRIND